MTLQELAPYIVPLIVVIVGHILNAQKMRAEIAKMRSASKVAQITAESTRDLNKAKADESVSSVAFEMIDRLSKRINTLEVDYKGAVECKQLMELEHEHNIIKSNSEIELLEEKLKVALIDKETSKARLKTSLFLLNRAILMADELRDQVISLDHVPIHSLKDLEELSWKRWAEEHETD